MERKTYYMILGVSNSENPRGIRAAYLDLARRLHPDVAGEQTTRAFQEITEAYEVLSDPRLRRDYNRKLEQAAEGEIISSVGRAPRPVEREPWTILEQPQSVRPSFEAMYDRFLRNFTRTGVPKSERLEALNFEVLLTPEEAARGCTVPVGVPVFRRCPQCDGSGRAWLYPCFYCHEQGMLELEKVLRIRIPPMVPSGTTFEIPLGGLGIHNFLLCVRVFLEAGARQSRREP